MTHGILHNLRLPSPVRLLAAFSHLHPSYFPFIINCLSVSEEPMSWVFTTIFRHLDKTFPAFQSHHCLKYYLLSFNFYWCCGYCSVYIWVMSPDPQLPFSDPYIITALSSYTFLSNPGLSILCLP